MATKKTSKATGAAKTATAAAGKKPKAAAIDEAQLMAFVEKAVGEFAVVASAALVVIGDKLDLYKAMADGKPVTSAELASRTKTTERYIREWLINQAASGILAYDPATHRYRLPPEHAVALTDESSPAYVVGGFQLLIAMIRAEPRIAEAFRTGAGMPWGEHDPNLFQGVERFFRPGYNANLVDTWIPALDGVHAKLAAGVHVADIGCGYGASTIIMARAYPQSRFYGFDNHAPSIAAARERAQAAGVADRVTFEVASAQAFPDHTYELIAFFDCLHDMGDPIGALQRSRATIAPDGTVLLVEPMAGDSVEENINPVGRLYSAASVLCCTPNAVATGPMALGTVATDDALREVAMAAGFSRFRRVMASPFNRFFEVRP
jgi:SAM-dependent methyltransferase